MSVRILQWIPPLLILAVASSATGQSGGPYELTWRTIDGGGGPSSGADYSLTGTIGQPDAGYSAGGPYELLGGFWPGGPLCLVEFEDYARFAEYWLETGTGLPADLYKDPYDIVDYHDLRLFVEQWLYYCPYDWPLR
ncbi:MAG TPA: hypothetical protein VMW16_15225 [Sedimentisphaerales bacterium]|nr:hypothetical protein [Sedimentisphaerales bacterium]